MSTSIRTELGVGSPGTCPVARAAADTGEPITKVARAAGATPDGTVTEEFVVDSDASVADADVEEVFGYESRRVFRFDRLQGTGCVCESIEQYGCPVSDIHARNGTLYVSFYAPDVETIQDIVNDLHARFSDIHVQQLSRADDDATHDFVFVDRNRMTDRQREVLETAYEMGYFNHPKRANAGEVAAALDIVPSTFSEHLAAAQRKLLDSLLDG